MFKNNSSSFTLLLTLLASLGGVAAHAAEARLQDPCMGAPHAPAAARPRMTLNSVTGNADRVQLSWESVPGATEYRIFREPRCPAQGRVQLATVSASTTNWSDTQPVPRAWYSVETTQSAGSGLARLSNAVPFAEATKSDAQPAPTAAQKAVRAAPVVGQKPGGPRP